MEEKKNLSELFKEVIDDNIALTKENKRLHEKIDDKDEIIESWVDEYNARCEYSRRLNKENIRLRDEMKLMVKDHEAECEDYETRLKSKVDLDDIHIIIANYMSNEYVPEYAVYILFKIMDKIKEYIDENKE